MKPAERRARAKYLADANWYRIRYALAVQWLQAADEADRPPVSEELKELDELLRPYENPDLRHTSRDIRLETAQNIAAELTAEVASVLYEDGRRWPRRRVRKYRPGWRTWRAVRRRPRLDGNVAEFLDRVIEPCAASIAASAMVERGELKWSKLRAPEPAADRRELRRFVKNKDQTLGPYLAYAAQDRNYSRTRKFFGFFHSRWRNPRMTSYRTSYNLACLYSRIATRERQGEARERAFDQLESSFDDLRPGGRRDQLVARAWADPALEDLRSVDEQKFRRIVGDRPGQQSPGPLEVTGPATRRMALLRQVLRGWGDR